MKTRSTCAQCGRQACAAVCLLFGGTTIPARLGAQAPLLPPTAKPTPIESIASVVIGAMFTLDPAQPILVESPLATDACFPLRCFVGGVLVRSNQRWQLQVSVGSVDGSTPPLVWLPVNAPDVVLSATWHTVASGTSPTAGTDVSIRVGVGGPPLRRPSASVVSASLRYRIIPLP